MRVGTTTKNRRGYEPTAHGLGDRRAKLIPIHFRRGSIDQRASRNRDTEAFTFTHVLRGNLATMKLYARCSPAKSLRNGEMDPRRIGVPKVVEGERTVM